jgi:hypothetical protein
MARSKRGGNRQAMPIWRDAQRLLLEIEQAVRSFPRYHKYTLGSDLRRQAMNLCRLLARAIAATGPDRAARVGALLGQIDDLKISIQLAKELKVFHSFAAFQRIAELVVAIGKQGGAWQRHLSRASAGPVPGPS